VPRPRLRGLGPKCPALVQRKRHDIDARRPSVASAGMVWIQQLKRQTVVGLTLFSLSCSGWIGPAMRSATKAAR
jgi:hypothetical protein